jgi:hypothetical protein
MVRCELYDQNLSVKLAPRIYAGPSTHSATVLIPGIWYTLFFKDFYEAKTLKNMAAK